MFSAIVVVEMEKGVVGQGLVKLMRLQIITKVLKMLKSLVKVAILNGTVPHVQEGKFGGARVFLKPGMVPV